LPRQSTGQFDTLQISFVLVGQSFPPLNGPFGFIQSLNCSPVFSVVASFESDGAHLAVQPNGALHSPTQSILHGILH
jgi:hypothetical protein